MNKTVFFIYSAKEAKLLEKIILSNKISIEKIDLIVSTTPGINLVKLKKFSKVLSFEDFLNFYDLKFKEVSLKASKYSIDVLNSKEFLEIFNSTSFVDIDCIRESLKNIFSIVITDSFMFSKIVETLIEKGMKQAISFSNSGKFRIKDLYPTNFLLDNNLFFKPHLNSICNLNQIKFKSINKNKLGWFVLFIRNWFFYFYRFIVLFYRSFKYKKVLQKNNYGEAHFLRSEVEFHISEPIIKENIINKKKYIYLLDNMLQSGDCIKLIKSKGYNYQPIHFFTNPIDVLRIFLKTIFTLVKVKNNYTKSPSNKKFRKYGYLGKNSIIGSVVFQILLNNLPEILLYKKQILNLINFTNIKYFVSYDQIDRYGAIQGYFAKKFNIPSLMIQSTCIEDLYYPKPLSMDKMIVDSKITKKILISSGASSSKISEFGTPSAEIIKVNGDKKIACFESNSDALTILIATQAFASPIDYNYNLIMDVIDSIDSELKSLKIIIKPHPRESIKKYLKIESFYKNSYDISINQEKFENILEKIDLVISRTSTVLQTAILSGTPCISYLEQYPKEVISRLIYLNTNATSKCLNREELKNYITSFTLEKNRRDIFKEFKKNRKDFIDEFFNFKNNFQSIMELLNN